MFKIFLVFLLLSNILLANVIIKDNKTQSFELEYLYDKSKKLTINEISKHNFNKTISNKFSLGYTKGYSWFKIKVKNHTEFKNFIFKLGEPYFEIVNFYEINKNTYKLQKNGLAIPIEKRAIYHHNPVFKFNLEKNQEKILYIQTKSRFGSFGEFNIIEEKYFYNKYNPLKVIIYVLYLGGLVVLIFLNIFLFFSFKEKVYLYYTGYITTFTLFINMIVGYDLYTFLGKYHYQLHFMPVLFVMFLLLFSKEFLEIKKYSNRLNKTFIVFIYIFLLLAFLNFINIEPWYEVFTVVTSLVFILLIYTAIYVTKKGHESAMYYIFALLIYIITISSISSLANGWLENSFIARYSFMLGAYFEIVFFSIMIVNRFYNLNKEKISFQKELIHTKNQNEITLQNQIDIRLARITNLLKEKEVLLKEVYFRIKENFNILIILFQNELKKVTDKKSKFILNNFIQRLNSISLVHKNLYENKDIEKINTKQYLSNIIENIDETSKKVIDIDYNIFETILNADDAISIGMIINESIYNSIKHNENKDLKLFIKLKLKDQNKLKLTISDNGKGFVDKNQDGLGINLIKQFSKKIKNSNLHFSSINGATVSLDFEIQTKVK